jgi:hypothetical protein
VAFGNGEALRQIGIQLGQVLTDLAAVKQQLADQQHAIDQIRQDTTAAINTGLAENRAVIRDGLTRANETISDPLTQIGSELVAIRGGIGQLDNQIKTAATAAVQQPVPEQAQELTPEPVEDQAPSPELEPEMVVAQQVEHDADTLRAAAGISAARLHIHRDTWAFLVERAGQDRHFHIPGDVTANGGTVQVDVSGRSLVAALTSLRTVYRAADVDPGTGAIAEHLYERIAKTVKDIAASPHSGDGADPVAIVIDDRIKTTGEQAGGGDDQPPAGEE